MSETSSSNSKNSTSQSKRPFFRRYWWLLVIVVIAVLVVAGMTIKGQLHNDQLTGKKDNPESEPGKDQANIYRDVFTEGHFYQDDSNARFTFPPVLVDEITEIEPLGYAASGIGMDETGAGTHIIPSDHMYVRTSTKEDPKIFKVYAVADCYLVNIVYHKGVWQDSSGALNQLDDYALHFQVSKNLFVLETCLTDLTPELKAEIGELPEGDQNFRAIPVKAGELLGQSGGSPVLRSIDFWAIDLSKPAQFIHTAWHGEFDGYSVNPLDYFIEPIRSQLYSKLPERPEPRAGQFAYDIDGKLIGDWFPLKNAGDYPDTGPGTIAQLGFFYANYDPSIVYVGYIPQNKVYVVRNNSPDPATIDIDSGLVKYELMNERNRTLDSSYFNTEATMLVQMLENRKIKIELFEGKTADQVSGFDSNAIEFYR